MNETEFFYWLQGYFELSGHTIITIRQAECIGHHAALVVVAAEHNKQVCSMRFADVRALARVIEMLEVPNWDQRRALTDKLIALVAEQFQHVIDPKAGPAEQQAKLNEAHGPPTIGGPGPSGTMYRC